MGRCGGKSGGCKSSGGGTKGKCSSAGSPTDGTHTLKTVKTGSKKEQSWHDGEKLQQCLLDFHQRDAAFPKQQVAEAQAHHVINLQIFRDELKQKGVVTNLEYTGSTYEGIKVPSTDMEFDVMVVLSGGKSMQADPAKNPLYAQLSTASPGSSKPLAEITKGNPSDGSSHVLNPLKAAAYFEGQLQRVINAHPEMKDTMVLRKHGPAVQMDVYKDLSRDKLFYSVDMVPSFQVPHGGRYYVAKPFKETGDGADTCHIDTWRLSFSPHEKDKIRNIDVGNQCRKQCMRIMKVLRDKEPGLHGLNSYILKTTVLSLDRQQRESSEHVSWCQPQLAPRLMDCLKHLASALEEKSLPHYYVPQYNLLGTMPEKQCENIMYRVKELVRSEDHFHALLNK